jgi:hypothetical protein
MSAVDYAVSGSWSDGLCILSLSDRLWSASRSTSPVGRTGLPWRHTEVGIWTPIPEDLWLPSALLRASGLGPTPVSLQGVKYLSTTEWDHSVVVQTIRKFPITYLSADSVGSSSHLTYLCNIELILFFQQYPCVSHSIFHWPLFNKPVCLFLVSTMTDPP